MAASLKIISEQLGLSKAAVSIYFKDPSTRRISKENKERIRRLADELNYRPNVIAQSLSSLKSHVIAILIPLNVSYFSSTFLNQALCGIQSVLFNKGYNFIFIPTRGSNSPVIVRKQLERSRGYDGFILFGTRACSEENMRENVEQMLKADYPFVVLNMPDLGYEINQIVNVTPKSSSAIRYLLELGHEKILLMAGARQAPDTVLAIQEYRECFSERGLAVNENLFLNGDYEEMVARSELLQAINNGIEFSAIYCLTDTMALGAYEALNEKGLKIPGDISVIGKNDSFFARFLNPPLTSVRVLMYEAGKLGAKNLLRRIESNETPRKIFLKNELILRLSSAVYRPLNMDQGIE
ncbi:MAG: LacI family transcriptional regulator [Spirochaetes bacterium]|nr:LacI family transcriptional regulator [Spirochaetota bacterium]